MARPDKIDQLPNFLNVLVGSPSIAEACRRTGIADRTILRYLVRSRMGDPELQEIVWMGVAAPFHLHVDGNAPALTATLIERNAMDRALNGHFAETFYQGQRQYERVKKPEFADWSDDDIDRFGQADDAYEMRPVLQHFKPSDQLTIKMLESWSKRYRPHQEIAVMHGGVLLLDAPPKNRSTDAQVFDADPPEAVEQRGGHLALAAPAETSEQMDAMVERGDFAPKPVAFVNAKGERTELKASPVVVEKPKDATAVPAGKASARHDAENIGYGRPATGGYRVA